MIIEKQKDENEIQMLMGSFFLANSHHQYSVKG
ncbi:hypothetical protein NTGHW29_140116 [Candidatus Nitrotoga sp. HW29]|nr:hypothetical protein NTGHW29_140116 [Candidatus Nitrotoga sp. HW29]